MLVMSYREPFKLHHWEKYLASLRIYTEMALLHMKNLKRKSAEVYAARPTGTILRFRNSKIKVL